jgi:hypothetical protein
MRRRGAISGIAAAALTATAVAGVGIAQPAAAAACPTVSGDLEKNCALGATP